MSSRREGDKFPSASAFGSSSKGKNVAEMSIPTVDQLNQGLGGVNLYGGSQGGDGWMVFSKKAKGKEWGSPYTSQNTPAVPPPLKNECGSSSKAWSSGHSLNIQAHKNDNEIVDDDYDDDDLLDDLLSDGYDSDASQKSLETELFESMDSLTIEQITDPEKQWHCPACKGGPDAIVLFPGLKEVIAHSKTKGSKNELAKGSKRELVKLHRELAKVLDEELRSRGNSSTVADEFFGQWIAPGGADKQIVWPPMLIIRNTQHDKDDNDKWIGMGNQELLDYFSDYSATKARHAYGPQGHRGMSVVIFEGTAIGYLEAARLNGDFENNGSDRYGWKRGGISAFYPGGKRKLFGYLAEKKDIDFFNRYCQGKSKIKFEMKSYHEIVVKQLRKMGEDNQLLLRYKNKVVEAQKHSKALEETYGIVSEKLRKTLEENHIVRQRTKIHHEKNKEEMDYQEGFFNEQLALIKEKKEHAGKIQQTHEDPYSPGEKENRAEDVKNFINSQDKEMESFVNARESLMISREERMLELKRKHFEEELALEKELNVKLAALMEKYKHVYKPGNVPSVNGNANS